MPMRIPFLLAAGVIVALVCHVAVVLSDDNGGLPPNTVNHDIVNRKHSIYQTINDENTHEDNIELAAIALCDKLRDRAIAYVQTEGEEDVEASLELLMFCTSIFPAYTHAGRWNVGLNLNQLGRDKLAKQYYQVSLMIDKANPAFYKGLGVTEMTLKNNTEGVRNFERAIQLKFNISSEAWSKGVRQFTLEDFKAWDDVGGFTTLNFLVNAYREVKRFRDMRHIQSIMVQFNTTDPNLYTHYMTNSMSVGDMKSVARTLQTLAVLKLMSEAEVDDEDAKVEMSRDAGLEHMRKNGIAIFLSGFNVLGTYFSDAVLRKEYSIIPETREFILEYCGIEHDVLIDNENTVPLERINLLTETCLQHSGALDVLLDEGADVNVKQDGGLTPLIYAASRGLLYATKWLIDHGADVHAADDHGMTAVHYAVTRRQHHLLPILATAGADMKAETKYGETPLALACRSYNPGTILDVLNQYHGAEGTGTTADDVRNMDEAVIDDADPYARLCLDTANVTIGAVDTSKDEKVPKVEDGGWRTEADPIAQSFFSDVMKLDEMEGSDRHHCDIDIRSDLTPDTFLSDYVRLSKPVLIRNGLGNFRRAKRNLKRSKLSKTEDVSFKVANIPYASTYGIADQATTMEKYLEYLDAVGSGAKGTNHSARAYIFENVVSQQSRAQALGNHFQTPSVMKKAVDAVPVPQLFENGAQIEFYLGPPMSGAPIHWHRSAWNILVYGKKRWYITAQPDAIFSNVPIVDFVQTDRYRSLKRDDKIMECTQHPGDIIYVPNYYSHGVLNLLESTGYASEFLSAEHTFSILHETGIVKNTDASSV